MPIQKRTATLTVAGGSAGLRCYTKTGDGIVREVCNDITVGQLFNAYNAKEDSVVNHSSGWFPGELSFNSSPESALCAIAWDSWAISLFYQDASGTIYEKRHEGKGWRDTEFSQPGAYIGTNIAAVHDEKAARVVLFFQDSNGFVLYRVFKDGKWGNAAKVFAYPAELGTGIGATATQDLSEIRVYFQDEEKTIREYVAAFDGKWKWITNTWMRAHECIVGDITAVSWISRNEQQVRVYVQGDDNCIVEHAYSPSTGWEMGLFKAETVPNADICAIVRNVGGAAGHCLSLLWAGQDKKLYQRVYIGLKWQPPVAFANMYDNDTYAGTWIGTPFNSQVKDLDKKTIRKVSIGVKGGRIVSLSVDYTDGTSAGSGPGPTADEVGVISMDEGVEITQIWPHADVRHVLGLKFGFNKMNKDGTARTSKWFGTAGDGVRVWSENGHAFAGFHGAKGADGINGLQPIWSTRLATADADKIPEINDRVTALNAKMKDLQARHNALKARVAAHREQIKADLKGPVTSAAAGILEMGQAVEYLYDLAEDMRHARLGVNKRRLDDFAARIQECKDLADELEKSTKVLEETAVRLRGEGLLVHEDIRTLQGEVAETSATLRVLKEQADALEEVIKSKKNEFEAKNAVLGALLAADTKKAEEARGKQLAVERTAHEIEQLNAAAAQSLQIIDTSKSDEADRKKEAVTKDYNIAVKALDTRRAEIKDHEARLTALREKLAGLRKADANSDVLEAETASTLAEVAGLHQADDTLCAQTERLVAQLRIVAQWSKDLDRDTVAQTFARDLLAIVDGALAVEQVKAAVEHLRSDANVDAEALRKTLKAIAEAK